MSALAIGRQPSIRAELPLFEVEQRSVNPSKDWSYLIPTIGTLALGVIFIANVPIGMAIGAGKFVFGLVAATVIHQLNLTVEDKDDEYSKELMKYPLSATLMGPILEEGFFRGFLQPLVTRAVVFLAPAAVAAFLGTGLSIAATVSIVATAALFGFIHIFNDHKNSHIQAVIVTIGGIVLGVTAAQFGLAAAIAAHIINNTLAVTLMKMSKEENAETSQTSPV